MFLRHFLLFVSALFTLPALAAATAPRLEWHVYGDAYYSYNFNRPAPVTLPSGAGVGAASAPDAKNLYRYYDVYDNQISLSLLELTVLARHEEVTLLADLDFGSFADFNAASGSGGGKSIDEVSKHIGQAVVSYRPVGSRFFFDAGKMYSHIGAETVKAKDNWNYSRTILFSYAMPFWHTGAHAGYDAIPEKLQTSLYVYNGWNSVYDNNRSKSVGGQVKFAPAATVSVAYNVLTGPERADSERDRKTVHELNASYTLSEGFSLLGDLVYGKESGVTVNSLRTDATWYGGFLAAKYDLNEISYLSPRFEVFRDQHGYILGNGPQALRSGTFTYGRRVAKGLDFRAEGRWDSSSVHPFTKGLVAKNSQGSALVALLFVY